MTARTRSFAALVFLVVAGTVADAAAQESTFADCKSYSVRRVSLDLAPDNPNRIIFTGGPNQPVVITCDNTMLSADRIDYDRDTQILLATGQVLFQQPDVRIVAARVEMNGKTKLGTFYEASGQAELGLQPSQKSLFGNLEPDIYFEGRILTKTGDKSYALTDGTLTTCLQATPRWVMQTSKGTIVLEKRAIMRNMVLKVKDVPLLYVPFMYYPINKEGRSTGFLMPSYSADGLTGSGIDNAFFLVMGRSADATFTHKWTSKAGNTFGSELRYVASPGSRGDARLVMVNQDALYDADGRPQAPASRSFNITGGANQELPRGFRLVANADYYTNVQTQQLFQQGIDQYTQRTRGFSADLSGAIDRYQITAQYLQRDTFYPAAPLPPVATRIGSAPVARLTIGSRTLGRSKVYLGGNVEGAYQVRQSDVSDPTTNLSLWRFTGGPRLLTPLGSLPFLNARADVSYNFTRWLESVDLATGAQVPVALNRQLLTLTASASGPSVSRVFTTKSESFERLKHKIEPDFLISWTSPFENLDRVAKADSADQIRGGSTRITYGLWNYLYAKRRVPEGSPPGTVVPARQILTAHVSQTYYSDAFAAPADPNVIGARPANLGDFLVDVRAFASDSVSASTTMTIDQKYKKLTEISASATIGTPRVNVTPFWSRVRPVDRLTGEADTVMHFLRTSTTINTVDNRVSGSYFFALNVLTRQVVDQRIVGAYNTQCCGVIFDYQSRFVSLPTLPKNRTFSISFTLAGLGTFANPFGSFGAK